jgi:RimJ/RimL family protein N-acetyltransferase
METLLTNGKELLSLIKKTTQANISPLVIPVGHPVAAYLRPIATADKDNLDAIDLQLLSQWRNKYVKSFLTEFNATPERTAIWLTSHVHHNDGKILFMLEDLNGNRLGHIGLAFINWETGYGEADAIVSGGDSPKGLMKFALQTSLTWAKSQLGLTSIGVRVRSDNSALEFYKKVGFIEYKRIALVRSFENDSVIWSEEPSVKESVASLVYMLYQEA